MSTLSCLQKLGVNIERSGSNVLVHGVGKYGFKASGDPLDVGNSGTTLRILPALLAAQNFESTLVGDDSVSKRPMDRIIKPLSLMGAQIQSEGGHAPIHVKGGQLSAINYQMPVASAQVKSAILLAGLFAEGKTSVVEKYKSRDHTERMIDYLGFNSGQDPRYKDPSVSGDMQLTAKPIQVPGDISSAAFFIIAALLLPDSNLTIKNVGLNPTRRGIIDVLEKTGAVIKLKNFKEVNNEPIADLEVSPLTPNPSPLTPLNITAKDIPLLVDEIPILAVLATQLNGTSIISGAQELRVKESDRLKAVSIQLGLMGANIEEKPDGLLIHGPTKLKGAVVDSGGDHRMAMSLAIAALVAEGQTTIKGAESIDISFPGFEQLLKN